MPSATWSSASEQPSAEEHGAGAKHELDDKPAAPDAKKQKTIEETLEGLVVAVQCKRL